MRSDPFLLAFGIGALLACSGPRSPTDANSPSDGTADATTSDVAPTLDAPDDVFNALDAHDSAFDAHDSSAVDAHDAGPDVLFHEPSLTSDFPDPFVLLVGTTYHAYATNAGSYHIQHVTSTDLQTWHRSPDALPVIGAWSSGAPGLQWAPSVMEVSPTRYVLYYAAQVAHTGQQCIGRGVASSPDGPFVDDFGSPLYCNVTDPARLWSIDPSPFRGADGTPYLVWRQDASGGATNADLRQLAPDGANFNPGSGTVTLLTRNAGSWEDPVMENPAMVLGPGGAIYLFYSANRWDTANYAIGYATCDSVVGPCHKVTTTGPWFGSFLSLLGPGGGDFFHSIDGRLWISMHGWTDPTVGYTSGGARSLWMFPLTFSGTRPAIAAP